VVAIEGLPESPPPLRIQPDEQPQSAEMLLEEAFRAKPASAWVTSLREAGIPVELALEKDRTEFIAGILDDPINRQLGRVTAFPWGDRGRLEQPGFSLRFGPAPRPNGRPSIPGLGVHTKEVLSALGFDADETAGLIASGAVPPSAGNSGA
jgi:crotonobetainyl-CoA:carnitine CoA-transferase CaiB-like acyl-CoA transferase